MRSSLLGVLVTALAVVTAAPSGPPTRGRKSPPTTEWTVDDVILCETAESFRISPDCHWVVWVKKVPDRDRNQAVGNLFLSSLTDEKQIQLTRGNESCTDPQWSPDGQRIAFLSARAATKARESPADEDPVTQVWLMSPFGGEPWQVTSRPQGVVSCAWSGPDSLVFAARDEKEAEEKVEPKDTTIVVEDEARQVPVRLFQLTLSSKKIKPLTRNNDRITTHAISPNGHWAVTFHERSVRYEYDNKVRPVQFLQDLRTGKRRPIFEDRTYNLDKVQWSPDSTGFFVSSSFTTDPRYMQASVEELHYYDVGSATAVKVDLQSDRGLSAPSEEEGAPAFQVTPEGVLALLADGAHNRLAMYTRRESAWSHARLLGQHDKHVFAFSLGSDARTLVYATSTASTPTQWYRTRISGDRLETPVPLTHLNDHLRPRTVAKSELVRWKGSLDEEVEGLLYYPHGYQAGNKYPLVVVIHGGPAMADLDAWDDTWSRPLNLLCQRGAFVLRPNYHGSTNYGLAWAESIRGKYYDLEIPDIEKGVDALIARGLVDPERLGVMGHSNGAILAAAMTVETSRYRAASIMAGTVDQGSDWAASKYGAAFDQYYFGKSPFEDPSLYVRKSPFYRLDRVRTPTLIFMGTEDKIIGPHQAWMHYRALQQQAKTPVRLLLFPGEGHELEQLTHQRRKLQEELAWFDKYLFKTGAHP